MLGDPLDADNPLGYAAVLAADERGELLAAGERTLAEYGLNAEFVPRSLGGRFDGADRFMRLMRAVFRRDCTLGIGYGVTSFIAAVPVWTSGSAAQRTWLANLLLGNRRAAAGYTELAHGADFTRTEFSARPHGADLVLTGGKQLINNVSRAEALVLFARTDDAPGPRGHSHVLVDLDRVPAGGRRLLPRFRTSGVRGCLLGGVEFADCPVPAGALVGQPGEGMETVLRAFQVTRSVLPGMVVGALDTQLRLATRFALHRRLYGRPVAELPQVRATLVGALLDLLAADCLATVVARALHVLPDQAGGYAAAVKHLVPALLRDANADLAVLLGASGYLREGPHAMFQKNVRDMAVVSLAHASSAACLATLVPSLPRLARRAWPAGDGPPARLFRLAAPLPELRFEELALATPGQDSLSAVLTTIAPTGEPVLDRLVAEFGAELRDLTGRCADLPPRQRTVVAGRGAFDLAARYTVVLAANAAAGVWRHNQDQHGFLADPAWLTGVLWRLARRLGRASGPLPEPVAARMYDELLTRHDGALGFDLTGPALAG
jgi:alkylation response protein AidB-like acyl-CoA dehydrogenase